MGRFGNMLFITIPSMKGGNNMLVGIIASFIFWHLVTHQDWWIKECHGNTWDEGGVWKSPCLNHVVVSFWTSPNRFEQSLKVLNIKLMYTTTLKGKLPKCKNPNINNCAKSLHLREIFHLTLFPLENGYWKTQMQP